MDDELRIVACDDHIGPHVFRHPDQEDDENCSNPVDLVGFEHACTDTWSIGWYLCTCGEPWLNQAQRCLTQPSPARLAELRDADTGSNGSAVDRG